MRRALPLLALVACGGGGEPSEQTAATTVSMAFARQSFFDAPFPSDDLIDAQGRVNIARFPNPAARPMIVNSIQVIQDAADGFALAGGVFFHLDGPVDPARLPGIDATTAAGSPVFLMAVEGGARTPLEVSFAADEAAFRAADTLALLPVQGFPLRPHALYAAVVMRALGDAGGKPLGQSQAMRALAAGERPAGLSDRAWDSYRRASAALAAAGVDLDDVAGMSAFSTGDPVSGLGVWRAHMLARPLPAPRAPFQMREVFPDYCVFSSTIDLPVYQHGTPPYMSAGGGFGAAPAVDHTEEANVFLTVPRRAQPAAGTPLVVYMRPGGGGEDPLVERGRQDAAGVTVTPGEGPARYLARAGFAGIIVDSPGAGRRYSGVDEQFVLFNVANGEALRDGIRQAALETMLVAHVATGLTVDASACPDGPGAAMRVDAGHLALMGHSTGAWIVPLVLAHEPAFGAAVLSGAGGSWIDNMLYKEKPLAVAGLIALFLAEDTPTAADPAVTLLQWAAEPADPQVYTRRILRERPAGETRPHILMEQGIVDHYILPRIANSVSLSLGLSLAGEARDEAIPAQLALAPLLPHAGATRVSLPARGNRDGVTAVVVQHPGDGIQDAHEIVFQTEAPKQEYRCFLHSFLSGTPQVVEGTTADAPCAPM